MRQIQDTLMSLSCTDLERQLGEGVHIHNLISKEINRAEPEYMNMDPPINAQDLSLVTVWII